MAFKTSSYSPSPHSMHQQEVHGVCSHFQLEPTLMDCVQQNPLAQAIESVFTVHAHERIVFKKHQRWSLVSIMRKDPWSQERTMPRAVPLH